MRFREIASLSDIAAVRQPASQRPHDFVLPPPSSPHQDEVEALELDRQQYLIELLGKQRCRAPQLEQIRGWR